MQTNTTGPYDRASSAYTTVTNKAISGSTTANMGQVINSPEARDVMNKVVVTGVQAVLHPAKQAVKHTLLSTAAGVALALKALVAVIRSLSTGQATQGLNLILDQAKQDIANLQKQPDLDASDSQLLKSLKEMLNQATEFLNNKNKVSDDELNDFEGKLKLLLSDINPLPGRVAQQDVSRAIAEASEAAHKELAKAFEAGINGNVIAYNNAVRDLAHECLNLVELGADSDIFGPLIDAIKKVSEELKDRIRRDQEAKLRDVPNETLKGDVADAEVLENRNVGLRQPEEQVAIETPGEEYVREEITHVLAEPKKQSDWLGFLLAMAAVAGPGVLTVGIIALDAPYVLHLSNAGHLGVGVAGTVGWGILTFPLGIYLAVNKGRDYTSTVAERQEAKEEMVGILYDARGLLENEGTLTEEEVKHITSQLLIKSATLRGLYGGANDVHIQKSLSNLEKLVARIFFATKAKKINGLIAEKAVLNQIDSFAKDLLEAPVDTRAFIVKTSLVSAAVAGIVAGIVVLSYSNIIPSELLRDIAGTAMITAGGYVLGTFVLWELLSRRFRLSLSERPGRGAYNFERGRASREKVRVDLTDDRLYIPPEIITRQ
jgi:hypothetical protein